MIDCGPFADNARVRFGIDVLLRETGPDGPGVRLEIRDASGGGPAAEAARAPQGYAIQRGDGVVRVFAGDDAGAMYGLLEFAEQLRHGTAEDTVSAAACAPYIARRGIKLNIPLDARTPSYSDAGTAAQENIETVWDFEFWREYLDLLALHRYNLVTLWSPHVFPSMVRVDKYPDVALDDVCRADIDWVAFQRDFDLTGANMVTPEVLGNLRVVKRLSMDEKIDFWRRVMQYGHDRGISFMVITWNIFPWGAVGKHGITDAQDNPVTADYYRESVKALFRTYPLLEGIGVTAGERMPDKETQEDWLWETYGRAVKELREEFPDRRIRFIHRHHWAKVQDILSRFAPLADDLDFSFKYARARLYSVPNPPWAWRRGILQQRPEGTRVWWNLRNDDVYHFRWGDPEYVRSFIEYLPDPESVTAGFYMGPDAYVFGRVVSDRDPGTPRRLEFDKQWYNLMLWGRLAFNPGIPDELFVRELAGRFPGSGAQVLFGAWQQASRIIPLVNRFHWHENDFQWNVEGCMSNPGRFHDVLEFMETGTIPERGLQSIAQAAKLGDSDNPDGPWGIARRLDRAADAALKPLPGLRPGAGPELAATLNDIEAMAHLGAYYADKIRGAAALAAFAASRDDDLQDRAVRSLEAAVEHWERYAEVAAAQYMPQLLARCGPIDFMATLAAVRRDVDLARDFRPAKR